MASPWTVLAPMVGGVLAALVGGTLGVWLGHRSEARQWARNSRMDAYAELMRRYAEVYFTLTLPESADGRTKVNWSEWNRALAVVSMVARAPVAAQALRVDEALWRLTLTATGAVDADGWRGLREPLEAAVLEFVNLAREELVRQPGFVM
jgi:hypothetical protein